MATTPSLNEQVARAMGVSAGQWHDNEGQQFEAGWPDYEGDPALIPQMVEWLAEKSVIFKMEVTPISSGVIVEATWYHFRVGDWSEAITATSIQRALCRLVLAVDEGMK